MIRIFLYCVSIFFSVLQSSHSQSIGNIPNIPFAVSTISINDIYNNPSKLYNVERNTIATSYVPSSFGLKELNQNSLFASFRDSSLLHYVKLSGNFSNLFTYSNASYSIGYRMLDNFIPAITINYSYLKIQNYNDYGNLTFNFGGLLILDNNLKFGFSISNLFNNSFESDKDISIQKALFGVEYGITDNFKVHLGTEIRIENNTGIILGFINEFDDFGKIGLAYFTEPEMIEADLLINTISNFFIIYNLNYHNYLGVTHQFGLGYQFE